MAWHKISAHILLIFDAILTDGIRMFLNTLTKKNRSQFQSIFFCSGIINLLFVV